MIQRELGQTIGKIQIIFAMAELDGGTLPGELPGTDLTWGNAGPGADSEMGGSSCKAGCPLKLADARRRKYRLKSSIKRGRGNLGFWRSGSRDRRSNA